ncbi:MAG: xanthine dehydrogenase family protein molybdopterin-binding subunit, partial [Halobacteriota archaeon]
MGYIGDNIARREDPALITGGAEYIDDLAEHRMVHMAVLRSQYGHAAIKGIDTSAAEAHGSVLDVFTAADVDASGVPGTIPVGTSLPAGAPANVRQDVVVPDRPLLAGDRARYQGQPVAVVVAEDRYDAYNALDLIEVEYDRLDAVTDIHVALTDDSPTIHDAASDNLAFDWEVGDEAAVDDAFERADHVVSIERDHQRLVGNPIEPRGSLATYRKGKLSVAISSQVPHMHQHLLSTALGVPENKIRVWTPDVGGAFGIKGKYYPEEILSGWCAMQLDRPVKWRAERSESFLADCQGRGHAGDAELALDEGGTILGLRVDDKKDLGAFVQRAAPSVSTGSYATLLSSQYTVPDIYCRVRGVFTNQAPTDAYRGSSRPEGVYVIERLMHEAAKELGVDPAELRRRNLIPADDFPYETPVLAVYDSGDYETALDDVLELADYDALRERQSALREEGRYLGIGISCFVEPAGSSPVGGSGGVGSEPAHVESSKVSFYPDGSVVAYCGTAEFGQGHRTTYAQILADELGIDVDDIEIREGDTDQAFSGTGSHSSRSVIMAGNSLAKSAQKVLDKGRLIAAQHLEAAPEDIEFEDGEFRVTGAPGRSVSITDVARDSYYGTNLPADVEPGLDATTYYGSEGKTYPYGTHVAVVEVDSETGDVTLEEYAAVDDCGVQINPKLIEGQVEGGIVQGIGQALYEGAIYDDNANLVTGSFQDYAMPRA